jgi:hypothetical protein
MFSKIFLTACIPLNLIFFKDGGDAGLDLGET